MKKNIDIEVVVRDSVDRRSSTSSGRADALLRNLIVAPRASFRSGKEAGTKFSDNNVLVSHLIDKHYNGLQHPTWIHQLQYTTDKLFYQHDKSNDDTFLKKNNSGSKPKYVYKVAQLAFK